MQFTYHVNTYTFTFHYFAINHAIGARATVIQCVTLAINIARHQCCYHFSHSDANLPRIVTTNSSHSQGTPTGHLHTCVDLRHSRVYVSACMRACVYRQQ